MIFNRHISTLPIFFFLILFCHFRTYAQSTVAPLPNKHEVRAVWLTTIGGLDWPHSYAQSQTSISRQKAELVSILDRLQLAGINTVLFQTRIRGTVVYPSAIEPWDGCCSGVPGRSPGYDPLEFVIAECHRRGIELQAWVVTVPAGKWNALGCKTLRRKYPNMMKRIGDDGFIDPQSPQAAPYIASICREITSRYDIDGIHLDYIRYPETWNIKPAMREQARRNITAIVRRVHSEVKALKPWVKLSCSPIGKHADLCRYSSHGWNALDRGCQPAQQWLNEGLMDQLYPMMYFRGNQFYPFLMDWVEHAYGRTVVPGLGVYFLSPSEGNWSIEEIERQINVLKQAETGFAFFRTKFLLDDTKGVYRFTADRADCHAALVPPMTWACRTAPAAPQNLSITRSDRTETLSWTAPTNISEGGILYNVYVSSTFPIDTDDPRNLIAVHLDRQSITLQTATSMNYAVTAINRYGIESRPIETQGRVEPRKTMDFIPNNGNLMQLPPKSTAIDADFIVIENMRGLIAATMPYHGSTANISKLPNGVYRVKTLNNRNNTHTVGTLFINRRITKAKQ